MRVRSGSPLAVSLVLGALVAFGTSARAAGTTRVGLADAATAGRGHATIVALRGRLESRPGLALPQDAARVALEEPLPSGDTGDVASGPRATQLVRAARDAYSRFDYDGALERLRQAELALATAPPVPDVTRLLVDLNLLMGVVEADRGDVPRALEALRVARRLDPTRKALDPGSYRPRVVALYAQAGAAEAHKSRLSVVTEPAGAEVWIDGTRAGVAPLAVTLEVGSHYVAAVTAGSTPRLEKPLLRAGEDTRLSLLLARLPPEERARQGRVELAAGRVGWSEGAAVLAGSASLDLLVVVRDAPHGGAEAAIFDARTGALGPWTATPPIEPVLLRLATALAPAAAPAPVAERDLDRGPRAPDRSRAVPVPWYRSWWVVPPLLAVGAAAALGTLWTIDRERTTTYSLNRWCFGSSCAP
jgi:PEGA domain